jgi:hypothetical protein
VRLFWLGLGRWSTWLAFLGGGGLGRVGERAGGERKKETQKRKGKKRKNEYVYEFPLCVTSQRASERAKICRHRFLFHRPSLVLSRLVLSFLVSSLPVHVQHIHTFTHSRTFDVLCFYPHLLLRFTSLRFETASFFFFLFRIGGLGSRCKCLETVEGVVCDIAECEGMGKGKKGGEGGEC